MILVTEAGYQGIVAFSASRTFPLSASMTNRASEYATLGASNAIAPMSAINEEWRSSGRISCTIRFRSSETRPTTKEVLKYHIRVSSVSGARGPDFGFVPIREPPPRQPIPVAPSRTEANSSPHGAKSRRNLYLDSSAAALRLQSVCSRMFLHHELGPCECGEGG